MGWIGMQCKRTGWNAKQFVAACLSVVGQHKTDRCMCKISKNNALTDLGVLLTMVAYGLNIKMTRVNEWSFLYFTLYIIFNINYTMI